MPAAVPTAPGPSSEYTCPQQSRSRSLSITCMRLQGAYSEQHLPLGVRELRPIRIPKNNVLINAPELLLKYNFLRAEMDVYKALGGSASTGLHRGWAGSPWLLPLPPGFCCRHLPCLHCSYASLWLFLSRLFQLLSEDPGYKP